MNSASAGLEANFQVTLSSQMICHRDLLRPAIQGQTGVLLTRNGSR